MNDFYFLNPQINHNCSNLWSNTSYCVQPVGNIQTYSGYPTPTPGTIFPKPTPPPTSAFPPVVTDALSTTAPGTIEGCQEYENAFSESVASIVGQSLDYLNSCDLWAADSGVSVDDLLAWNPSLSSANCTLQPGNSYCVLKCKFLIHSPPVMLECMFSSLTLST